MGITVGRFYMTVPASNKPKALNWSVVLLLQWSKLFTHIYKKKYEHHFVFSIVDKWNLFSDFITLFKVLVAYMFFIKYVYLCVCVFEVKVWG